MRKVIYRLIASLILWIFPDNFRVSRSISGFRITFPAKYHLGLFFFRPYEETLWSIVQRKVLIPPEPYIFDIGANIGQSTLNMASIFRNKIISFEPDPRAFPVLIENIHNNGLQRQVELINKAVFHFEGKIFLNQDFNTGGRKSSLYNNGEINTIEVETISLRYLIEKFHPRFIKIDAENAEWEMLMGCDIDLIKDCFFYIETCEANLEKIIMYFSETHNIEEIKIPGFLFNETYSKYHFLIYPN